jgi:hypothetical protein
MVSYGRTWGKSDDMRDNCLIAAIPCVLIQDKKGERELSMRKALINGFNHHRTVQLFQENQTHIECADPRKVFDPIISSES